MNDLIKCEVSRCFNCVNKPCMNMCPLSNDIPRIISLVKNEMFRDAYEVLTETTVFPSVASIVCPHDRQCKSKCTAKYSGNPIDIGAIENFLGRLAIKNNWKFSCISSKLNGINVAVVGAGPAGLTASAFLARNGAKVTVFEKQSNLGGLLRHGIPEFRLSKALLNDAINKILEITSENDNEKLISVHCKMELGKNLFLDDLKENFDAIFLAFGSNVSKQMSIKGEDLNGVLGGNELLEYESHPDYTDKVVFVSGGGNVAIDVARTIKRLGAKEVTIIYRRSECEMPADVNEYVEAKNDGIKFLFNTNLIEIHGDKSVEEIECMKTFYDGEAIRNNLKNLEGSNFVLKADYVIMAVGSKIDLNLAKGLKLDLSNTNYIKIDDNYISSDDKILAIGDLAGVTATVAWASASGRRAVEKFIEMRGE